MIPEPASTDKRRRAASSTPCRPDLDAGPLGNAFACGPAAGPPDARSVPLAQDHGPCAVAGCGLEDLALCTVRQRGRGARGPTVHQLRIHLRRYEPAALDEGIRALPLNRPGHAGRQTVLAVKGRT